MIEDSCPLSQSAAVDLSGGVSVSAGLLCISGIIPRIPDVVAGCARPFQTVVTSNSTVVGSALLTIWSFLDQRQLVLPVATTIFAGHMW